MSAHSVRLFSSMFIEHLWMCNSEDLARLKRSCDFSHENGVQVQALVATRLRLKMWYSVTIRRPKPTRIIWAVGFPSFFEWLSDPSLSHCTTKWGKLGLFFIAARFSNPWPLICLSGSWRKLKRQQSISSRIWRKALCAREFWIQSTNYWRG